MISSPCYKCSRRADLCWNNCDDYKAYKKELEKAKQEDKKQRDIYKTVWRRKS